MMFHDIVPDECFKQIPEPIGMSDQGVSLKKKVEDHLVQQVE